MGSLRLWFLKNLPSRIDEQYSGSIGVYTLTTNSNKIVHKADRIRILYFNNVPFIGGAQITLRAIIQRLDRRRFEPFLALPIGRADLIHFFAEAEVPVITVPMRRLNPPTVDGIRGLVVTVVMLRTFIRRTGIQIVHSNTQRGGPLGIALKWTTGAKFVWTLNDIGLSRRVRVFTPFPDAITCVSKAMFDSLREWQRRHARVIYNGVVVDRPLPETRETLRQELRSNLAIPNDALVVGTVSRLDRWKGVHVVIEAMRIAMATNPSVWFVLIGDRSPDDPNYGKGLAQQCNALPGQRGRVLGFQRNIQHWYSAFDILVHAPIVVKGGHTESFGMAVAEAMGHGLPVVTSAVGGLPEVVADGESGVIVPPDRPDLLAKAICDLFR